jgi:hypothetical protein
MSLTEKCIEPEADNRARRQDSQTHLARDLGEEIVDWHFGNIASHWYCERRSSSRMATDFIRRGDKFVVDVRHSTSDQAPPGTDQFEPAITRRGSHPRRLKLKEVRFEQRVPNEEFQP